LKEISVKILRTPEERFENLPDYPFAPHYVTVDKLRVHYVDEGMRDGPLILMLHGEPSWSFLYRHMIPLFVDAGFRAVAPDLIGFGKSDKPAQQSDYTYQNLVDWTGAWVEALGLREINLVCQDWGSLIGLRLVAEHPEYFSRVVVANGGMPTGDQTMPDAFLRWRRFCLVTARLPIGRIINGGTTTDLAKDVRAAYEAPFPDESFKEGARILPGLVPTTPEDPATPANRSAWESLKRFDKPLLTAFSDGDPITAGGERAFQLLVPGAKGQAHTTITGAGHYLQEDKGPELAKVVIDFVTTT
jgi:haloalkane dehalogenase